jgi:hypothetical protein
VWLDNTASAAIKCGCASTNFLGPEKEIDHFLGLGFGFSTLHCIFEIIALANDKKTDETVRRRRWRKRRGVTKVVDRREVGLPLQIHSAPSMGQPSVGTFQYSKAHTVPKPLLHLLRERRGATPIYQSKECPDDA